jgi:hypothetical protein
MRNGASVSSIVISWRERKQKRERRRKREKS